jgi:hypothetical protein
MSIVKFLGKEKNCRRLVEMDCITGSLSYWLFNGECIDHLLLHCIVANDLWSFIFLIFDDKWAIRVILLAMVI